MSEVQVPNTFLVFQQVPPDKIFYLRGQKEKCQVAPQTAANKKPQTKIKRGVASFR